MNDIVIPKFDIELMSRIVLGKKHWNNISPSEKSNFMDAFKNLMVKTYMKSLTAFEGEKIKFLPFGLKNSDFQIYEKHKSRSNITMQLKYGSKNYLFKFANIFCGKHRLPMYI